MHRDGLFLLDTDWRVLLGRGYRRRAIFEPTGFRDGSVRVLPATGVLGIRSVSTGGNGQLLHAGVRRFETIRGCRSLKPSGRGCPRTHLSCILSLGHPLDPVRFCDRLRCYGRIRGLVSAITHSSIGGLAIDGTTDSLRRTSWDQRRGNVSGSLRGSHLSASSSIPE